MTTSTAGPKDILEQLKAMGLPETFCPVPFFSTYFEANGKVCLCRQKGNEFAVGRIQEQSFEDIWNGEKLRAIREEFLSGKVRTCAAEIARDHCNLSVDHAEYLPLIRPTVHQSRGPLRITPNFNGHCNLRCEMCHVWKFPDGLYDEIGFWPKLEKTILPSIREIDHFSGEPFAQKDTFRLIDMASRVNPKILWSFTTNGHWRLNGTLRGHLDRIVIKNFIFSIDSLDSATFASIRKNGDLSRVLASFRDVQNYESERIAAGKSPMGITINFTLQRSNWRDIPAILAFIKKERVRICFRCLSEPGFLSVSGLPKAERTSILEFLLQEIPPGDLFLIARLLPALLEDLEGIERARLLLEYQRLASINPQNSQANTPTLPA